MGTPNTTPNAHVHYNNQQIIKRENPSCWLDLSPMSRQKWQSNAKLIHVHTCSMKLGRLHVSQILDA